MTRAAYESLLTQLDAAPVLGVSLQHITLLRLDRMGGAAPGNKHFKLQHYLDSARARGVRRLVSFGGAWSNHLHALAAMGCEHDLETVGIVRGEPGAGENPTLKDARAWGMRLVFVDRTEYRLRNDAHYLQAIEQRYGPCLVIPEGGASVQGAAGCRQIATLASAAAVSLHIVLPVGTGTTLAGIVSGLGPGFTVTGISALKGAHDLESRVAGLLDDTGGTSVTASWRILHQYHCGGFARADRGLKEFMRAFESLQGIPLEPVYTGKMLYALYCLARDGQWDTNDTVLALHTGGLQGRRGFPWLSA